MSYKEIRTRIYGHKGFLYEPTNQVNISKWGQLYKVGQTNSNMLSN